MWKEWAREKNIKGIYTSEAEGKRLRERPTKGRRDGGKEVLGHRGLGVQEGKGVHGIVK